MNLSTSNECFEPRENIYSDNYSVAQMYKPALVAFIEKSSWERYEAAYLTDDTKTHPFLKGSVTCSNTSTLGGYREIVLGDFQDGLVCRIFYFTPLSFPGNVRTVMLNQQHKDFIILNFFVIGQML